MRRRRGAGVADLGAGRAPGADRTRTRQGGPRLLRGGGGRAGRRARCGAPSPSSPNATSRAGAARPTTTWTRCLAARRSSPSRRPGDDRLRPRPHAPGHRPAAHPRADRLRGRGRADGAALAADVAAGVGPGAHRQPGGALAGARRRARRRACVPTWTCCTTPSATRASPGPICRCCGPTRPAATCPTCAIRPLIYCVDAPPEGGDPLLSDRFVLGMIAQHEQQHDETMLATHQLRGGPAALHAPDPPPAPADAVSLPREVLVPGGPFTMGTSADPWALDNERPAHTVEVPAFFLDTVPVGNGAYQEFIADGGYRDRRWWTCRGLGAPRRGRPRGAAVLEPGRRGLAAPPLRRGRAGAGRGAGDARVLVRGRRVRALGRAAAADRGRVGEGGAARSGARPLPPLPVGRRGSRSGARQSGPAAPASRARSAGTRPAPRRSVSGN